MSFKQREPSERKPIGCLPDPPGAQTSPGPPRGARDAGRLSWGQITKIITLPALCLKPRCQADFVQPYLEFSHGVST